MTENVVELTDEEMNLIDAAKLENTDKRVTEADGEQPQEVLSWNDDSGEVEILDD